MPLPKGRLQIVVEPFRADLRSKWAPRGMSVLVFTVRLRQSSIPRSPAATGKGVEKLLSHFALQIGGFGYFLELFHGALDQPEKQLGEGAIALREEIEFQR